MKLTLRVLCVSLLFLPALAVCHGCKKSPSQAPKPLRCYVGGTMVPVITELAKTYQQETGQEIEIDHADSGQLLIKIEQTGRGDLYVCHDPFLGALMKKGLGTQGWTLAVIGPVIITPKTPRAAAPKIEGLKDLARPGVRLGLTHETYSTLGHINPVMFEKAGLRAKIEANVKTRTRSGGQVRASVEMGHLDAAIVWNAVAHLGRDKLRIVPIAPEYLPDAKNDAVTSATYGRIDMSRIRVTIATLKCSKQAEQAKAFAEFVASERAGEAFKRHGFSPAEKETILAPGATRPTAGGSLDVFCGAGIRQAMEELIQAYTKATGVKVRAEYAGSGILLTRLKLIRRGDLYVPADVRYVLGAEGEDLIASRQNLCYFIPVILVQKGNPKGIQKLEDLARPGLRIGLGRPEAVAIGTASEQIFEKNKLDRKAIEKNVVTYTLTVNELGGLVENGQLDAAIVWDAIAAYYKGRADVVPIPPQRNVISNVAGGVLKVSKNQGLAEDFLRFLRSKEGQTIFQNNGYTVVRPK